MQKSFYTYFVIHHPEHNKISSVSTTSDALTQFRSFPVDSWGLRYQQTLLLQFFHKTYRTDRVILRNIVTDGLQILFCQRRQTQFHYALPPSACRRYFCERRLNTSSAFLLSPLSMPALTAFCRASSFICCSRSSSALSPARITSLVLLYRPLSIWSRINASK
nr:MAG TPA_asm: hypothetical protein [Caudoviricetes sp.]